MIDNHVEHVVVDVADDEDDEEDNLEIRYNGKEPSCWCVFGSTKSFHVKLLCEIYNMLLGTIQRNMRYL